MFIGVTIIKLQISYKGQLAFEVDKITIAGQGFTVRHITASGFLYLKETHSCERVTVHLEDASTCDYYSDWDTLEFLQCEVNIVKSSADT